MISHSCRGFTPSLKRDLASFVPHTISHRRFLTRVRPVSVSARRSVSGTRARSSAGFTLIELLVVIAIIGLLASVVIASLASARSKGRDARRIADISQIQTALELFVDDSATGEYPDDIYAAAPNGLGPKYLATVPRDPNGGNYSYDNLTNASAACAVATGVCTAYVVGAVLEDTAHKALGADVDGTVGSVNCEDSVPRYCVKQ